MSKFQGIIDSIAEAIIKKIEKENNSRIAILETKVDDILQNHLPTIETKQDDLSAKINKMIGGFIVVQIILAIAVAVVLKFF